MSKRPSKNWNGFLWNTVVYEADSRRSSHLAVFQLSPEEELEKQYRDYKAQFEQWKEKNRNSVGTEAYTAYVEQFEAWEKDVDKRREMIRAKAETEAQEAQAAAAKAKAQATAAAQAEAKRKKEREAEEEQKKKLDAEAAAQAAAYAQSQQSYLAHHQAALQKEQQMRQSNANNTPTAQDLVGDMKMTEETFSPSQMAETMKQMAQVAEQVLIGEQQSTPFTNEGGYQPSVTQAAAHSVQQHPQQQQQQPSPPPQLWGSDRKVYDATDPMFKRWGIRAAPPYFEPASRPPPPDFRSVPCWLVLQQMNEDKLAPAPQIHIPPPPAVLPFAVQP